MLHLKTFCTRSIGWALYGVNFRPLQEIEAIMGGGRIFDTGPFFARLQYMYFKRLQCSSAGLLLRVGSYVLCKRGKYS